MVRRWTELGAFLDRDPVAGRARIVEAIEECGGNVRRAAFVLDVTQSWLCRLIVRHSLRGVVAEARRRAARPTWLVQARRLLVMDEQIQAIVDACAGMTEDEILGMITTSENAGAFQDPGLVAAYVASLVAAA